MQTEILIRKAAIRVAHETDDPQLRRALLEILAKGLPPEFLENIKKKKEEAKDKGDDEEKGSDKEAKKDLPPEFLENIKGKDGDGDGKVNEKSEKPWEKKKKALREHLYELFLPMAREEVMAFYSNNPSSKVASASTAERVQLADKMAKDWIEDAVKHPGRVRKYLGKKPGEKITASEIDAGLKKAKKSGNKSLVRALNMAKTLIKQ
jgi:hypothetical protein